MKKDTLDFNHDSLQKPGIEPLEATNHLQTKSPSEEFVKIVRSIPGLEKESPDEVYAFIANVVVGSRALLSRAR